MSPVGLTRDAGWEIGVSRTIDLPPEEVWEFVSSPEGIRLWLGEGVRVLPEKGERYETDAGTRGETRSLAVRRRIRLTWQPADWDHDTTLQLGVSTTASGKARLGVHQERLADAEERERQREHWRGVIAAIAAALER